MICILDPAHGDDVPGKRSPDGRLLEYKWSREIISMIEARLSQLQIPYKRSWYGENEPGLLNRCKQANKIAKADGGPAIFVSVHVNASGNDGKWKSARGWSVFVSTTASSNSKKLASLMATDAKVMGQKVRVPDASHNYWKGNFTVLNKTSMPAVLVENLFQDNKEDVEYLLSEEGKVTLCEIIVKGVCDYFGIQYTNK